MHSLPKSSFTFVRQYHVHHGRKALIGCMHCEVSYLDLPELDALARVSPTLAVLAQDPVLHHIRLFVIAPSRVQHALFALGGTLRPSVSDLVHWNVMRGLGLERRWRTGLYLHSPQVCSPVPTSKEVYLQCLTFCPPLIASAHAGMHWQSVKQFETSQRLQRTRVQHLLSTHLQHTRAAFPSRAAALQSLHSARVLPDEEGKSLSVARSLLPIMRKLKWSFQRDTLARMVRAREGDEVRGPAGALLLWLEGKGRGLWKENERLRLAICPSIAKNVRFFESLGK